MPIFKRENAFNVDHYLDKESQKFQSGVIKSRQSL